jgi:methyl-accepting chemotaxis protein
MNAQIATAAEEQSAMVGEVNRNIISINKVTHNAVEGARQTAVSSEALASVATEMGEMIDQFKT